MSYVINFEPFDFNDERLKKMTETLRTVKVSIVLLPKLDTGLKPFRTTLYI